MGGGWRGEGGGGGKEVYTCSMCVMCDTHTPSHPSAADEAWYWPSTLGDCLVLLTARPEGHLWPRELWFSIDLLVPSLSLSPGCWAVD